MLEMTQTANDKLKEYLTQNKLTSAVRVMVTSSCSGQSLVLSLDEKKTGDTSIVKDELELIIDKVQLVLRLRRRRRFYRASRQPAAESRGELRRLLCLGLLLIFRAIPGTR